LQVEEVQIDLPDAQFLEIFPIESRTPLAGYVLLADSSKRYVVDYINRRVIYSYPRVDGPKYKDDKDPSTFLLPSILPDTQNLPELGKCLPGFAVATAELNDRGEIVLKKPNGRSQVIYDLAEVMGEAGNAPLPTDSNKVLFSSSADSRYFFLLVKGTSVFKVLKRV